MVIVYVVQVALVTIYLPALLMIRFNKDRALGDRQRLPCVTRILMAVQHSTSTFLNASFVFSIAMLSASIMSLARGDDFTYSMRAMLLLTPCISVLPVALLHLAASDILHRHRGRFHLWLLTFLLLLAALMLRYLRRVDDQRLLYTWENACIGTEKVYQLLRLASGLAVSLLLGMAAYLIHSIIMGHQRKPVGRSYVQVARWLWWVGLSAAYLAMWLSLGWFIHFQNFRNRIAGSKNNDTKWSFGQLLAAATWVPVIVEFGYIWWESPVEAMNGWLVGPYEVKDMQKKAEDVELSWVRETV
jgi:hypothetical protein